MEKNAKIALLLTYFLILLCILTCQPQASDISFNSFEDRLSHRRGEAKETSKISAKVKFSFGYDSNVSEQRENKIESRFFQFYVSSGMYMFPSERTFLSLKLQDGLKYLDAPSLSGESVLINCLNLYLSHKLSKRLMPEFQGNIRGRTSIHNDSGVLPSEEAYLRGLAGLALKAAVHSDVTGKVFYHYRFTNFENFDPFDRRGPLIGLKADVRLLPGSTMSVQYSREKIHFDQWNLVFSDGKPSRTDITNDITFYTQFYKYFLFNITYSHQNNKSDIDSYSYIVNKFAVLMARNLSRGFIFQLYALVRSKKYCSVSNESISTQGDLEDDDRGVLTIKLSKDISKDAALEAQYDLRKSRFYKENGFYTKGVFSLSLSSHF